MKASVINLFGENGLICRTIHIDDVIHETITQYDILRTLLLLNNIAALSVLGKVLVCQSKISVCLLISSATRQKMKD